MKKICFIASSGGHLEQIRQLKKIRNSYDYFYITNRTPSTEKIKEKTYLVKDLYRKNNKFFKVVRLIEIFWEQFIIFIKENPDVIITTGAGMVIPLCLIAKIFKRKIIYIESYARMSSVNRTGKFLYRYADLFIVQWPELLKYYPKAVYGGCIY